MKRFFRSFRFSMFFVALLCLALGVIMVLWPESSQRFFCCAFGVLLILSGVIEIAVYLAGAKKGLAQKIVFLGGIAAAVAGVWILLMPDRVRMLTVIVMGIVLLYHGAMDIKYAFDMKRQGSSGFGIVLVFGLLTVLIGVLLLVDPFENDQLLFFVVAAGFIFDGVSDLFTVFAVAVSERRYLIASEKVEAIEGSGTIVSDTLSSPSPEAALSPLQAPAEEEKGE